MAETSPRRGWRANGAREALRRWAVGQPNHASVDIRRLSLATGEQVSIRPRAPNENYPSSNIVPMPDRDAEIRWNWHTPFILSRNDGVSA